MLNHSRRYGGSQVDSSQLENVYLYRSPRKNHREAPLLSERESFLVQMLTQGTSRRAVRSMATMLLHIIRLMNYETLRQVDLLEIQQSSISWLSDSGSYRVRRTGPTTARSFIYMATRFFKFHNVLRTSASSRGSNDNLVETFRAFLRDSQGVSPTTQRCYTSRVSNFLRAVVSETLPPSQITLRNVDDFLQMKQQEGCAPHTIVSFCAALRLFFRFGELQGWIVSSIASGIESPRLSRPDSVPKGPKWQDVRRLLKCDSHRPAELRATAIMSMCAIYGMRSSEVTNFRLADFDWIGEVFTVIRSKSGKTQQFPIQFEVGETILRYLRYGRPRCSCRSLFVTLKPPYRPVKPATIWGIVADRMNRLNIDSVQFGGHALRHSCATELLRKNTPLREIADFLGHSTMNSVSIYAKHDIRSLRQVATFSLAGVK
jgi:integrase/recombinase XerD